MNIFSLSLPANTKRNKYRICMYNCDICTIQLKEGWHTTNEFVRKYKEVLGYFVTIIIGQVTYSFDFESSNSLNGSTAPTIRHFGITEGRWVRSPTETWQDVSTTFISDILSFTWGPQHVYHREGETTWRDPFPFSSEFEYRVKQEITYWKQTFIRGNKYEIPGTSLPSWPFLYY